MYGKFIEFILKNLNKLVGNKKMKEKISKALNVPATLPNQTFVSRVTALVKDNKVATATGLATALYAGNDVLNVIFDGEDYSEVLSLLQDFDPATNQFTDKQVEVMESSMGDRKPGYYGLDEKELLNSAEVIKRSLRKTQELARLLGVHESDVFKVCYLIQTYEAADGEIYDQLGK